MTTVGIICEYNPFHNGHEKQIRLARKQFGEDCGIVCLMSGSYVQRGEPAIFDKHIRAQAAIACGADVVLELPVLYALSSAEGFASGGVKILTALGIDYLCFGCESEDGKLLMSTAEALLQSQMDERIRAFLQTGISYAAAREQALTSLYPEGAEVIRRPNDILAVEYCKAIMRQNSLIQIFPLLREGDYHAVEPDKNNPSAASIRMRFWQKQEVAAYLPPAAFALLRSASCYSLFAGERAILARLKGMTEEDFSKLPYGSEGLWRRLMRACRTCTDTQAIIEATKSKRYARARIQRMLLCAFLGLTEDDFARPLEYVRILSFSERGRQVLRLFKERELSLISATQRVRNSAYDKLENRCEQMLFLFRED